jgi:methyltransferase family protein
MRSPVTRYGSVLAFYLRDALLLQNVSLPTLLDEAWRLEPFRPPFSFSAFFSPEDTLLCVCAADAAHSLLTGPAPAPSKTAASRTSKGKPADFRVVELTSGSGLVGLSILRQNRAARLLGLDVERESAHVAERNAILLDLHARTRFARADLWSATTLQLLEKEKPRLIVCNPPYVPEPPTTRMQIEAGAGPHGTAHLLRALELTRLVQPDALALSWCSLSDPAGIVAAADGSGYDLRTLYVTAIADGEYSGSVHSYLRELSNCFISEQPETLAAVAPDSSARFSYLLLSGAFIRREAGANARSRDDSVQKGDASPAGAVEKICTDFARDGIRTLESATAPFPLHCSILTRWDELELRVLLHGDLAAPPTDAV